MTRGVVLFAHNTATTDYYQMAVRTAKRVNEYLDLPVTIITGSDSVTASDYTFDRTFFVEADETNFRHRQVWKNKGRYQAYALSPYDETILLDTDYLINSQTLLKTFDLPSDIVCHKNTTWLFGDEPQEQLSDSTVQSLWATVVRFNRSSRVQQTFEMLQMVQENYEHYANIYKFMPYMYRNDYALTIALKTVNGHLEHREDYIPWDLVHVSKKVKAVKESETQYALLFENPTTKKHQYIRVRDIDFHMLNKENFMELTE